MFRNSGIVTLDLIEFEPSLANRQKLSLTFQNVEAVKFQEVRATEVVQVIKPRLRLTRRGCQASGGQSYGGRAGNQTEAQPHTYRLSGFRSSELRKSYR